MLFDSNSAIIKFFGLTKTPWHSEDETLYIQLAMDYVLRYRQHFVAVIEQQLRVESAEAIRANKKQLERNESRISELKRLFIKIYEDNTNGKLSDERFDMLSQTYETEQKQLEAEVIKLRQGTQVQEQQNENIKKFVRKAESYIGIEKFDPYSLRELIKAIYVDAPDKSTGKRTQHIHIEYDGIGFIPLAELIQKKTAWPKSRRYYRKLIVFAPFLILLFYGARALGGSFNFFDANAILDCISCFRLQLLLGEKLSVIQI